jgi:hypothetical protein
MPVEASTGMFHHDEVKMLVERGEGNGIIYIRPRP